MRSSVKAYFLRSTTVTVHDLDHIKTSDLQNRDCLRKLYLVSNLEIHVYRRFKGKGTKNGNSNTGFYVANDQNETQFSQ